MPKLKLSDLFGHPKKLYFEKGYIEVYPLDVADMHLFLDIKKNQTEIVVRTLKRAYPELSKKEIEESYKKMHWQYKLQLHNTILEVNKLLGPPDKKKEQKILNNKSSRT